MFEGITSITISQWPSPLAGDLLSPPGVRFSSCSSLVKFFSHFPNPLTLGWMNSPHWIPLCARYTVIYTTNDTGIHYENLRMTESRGVAECTGPLGSPELHSRVCLTYRAGRRLLLIALHTYREGWKGVGGGLIFHVTKAITLISPLSWAREFVNQHCYEWTPHLLFRWMTSLPQAARSQRIFPGHWKPKVCLSSKSHV